MTPCPNPPARLASAAMLLVGAALAVELVSGHRPGYVTALMASGVAAATLSALQVRRHDALGWTLTVACASTVAACQIIAHSTGLPGLPAEPWDTWAMITTAGALAALGAGIRAVIRRVRRPSSTAVLDAERRIGVDAP